VIAFSTQYGGRKLFKKKKINWKKKTQKKEDVWAEIDACLKEWEEFEPEWKYEPNIRDTVCTIAAPQGYNIGTQILRKSIERIQENKLKNVPLSKRERDLGLRLSAGLLEANAANYSVWQYRRALLEIGERKEVTDVEELQKELEFVSEMSRSSPKNYQIWHHRQQIASFLITLSLHKPSQELDFTTEIFLEDAKNYHAWTHR